MSRRLLDDLDAAQLSLAAAKARWDHLRGAESAVYMDSVDYLERLQRFDATIAALTEERELNISTGVYRSEDKDVRLREQLEVAVKGRSQLLFAAIPVDRADYDAECRDVNATMVDLARHVRYIELQLITKGILKTGSNLFERAPRGAGDTGGIVSCVPAASAAAARVAPRHAVPPVPPFSADRPLASLADVAATAEFADTVVVEAD